MGSVIARSLGVSVRGCMEFLLARCGAEIIGLPLPDFACRGFFALDRHAADRIGDLHLLSLLSMELHAFVMVPAIDGQHFARDGATLDWRRRSAPVTMPLTSNLTRISVVTGMLSGKRALIRRRRTVDVTGRGQRAVVGVQSYGRCREWRSDRIARTIILIPLPSAPVVVTAMAYATAASAGGEKCECAHAKRDPNPVAAEPIHCGVPSVSGTFLARAGSPGPRTSVPTPTT